MMLVGSGDIAPRLLDLATWLKYVVTSHLVPSTQGRNPHTYWRLCQMDPRTVMDALEYMCI